MKKILLTGSTGFIGSELLKDLSKDNKVYITLRRKISNKFKSKNIVAVQFKNYKELSNKLQNLKINSVIHCATHYVKSHNLDDIEKLGDSNILFGNIILENLEKMAVKKFINFSTVWEHANGKKDNYNNLYSAYKASFRNIIRFYKKKYIKTRFLNLVVSDTFGNNDKRKKIVKVLKTNYKKKIMTKIISKNLYINLLNVSDIKNAIRLILKKDYKSNTYLLQNKYDFKISDIIADINKYSDNKIKIKWLSNAIIKEKTYKFRSLKNWKPCNSKIEDLVKVITE